MNNHTTPEQKADDWIVNAWECQHANFDIEKFAKHVARLAYIAGHNQGGIDEANAGGYSIAAYVDPLREENEKLRQAIRDIAAMPCCRKGTGWDGLVSEDQCKSCTAQLAAYYIGGEELK